MNYRQPIVDSQEPNADVSHVTCRSCRVPVVVQFGESGIDDDSSLVHGQGGMIQVDHARMVVCRGGQDLVFIRGRWVRDGDALEESRQPRCQEMSSKAGSLLASDGQVFATRSVSRQLKLGNVGQLEE